MTAKGPELKKGLTVFQKAILDTMLSGKNVFLTGSAGTGKSFLLSQFMETAGAEYGRNILATAPTEAAAQNLKNGMTMHRAFHIRFGYLDPSDFPSDPSVFSRYLIDADIVIIDEISMCRRDVFDCVMSQILILNRLGEYRKKQVIVVGDFYQLPPVLPEKEYEVLKSRYDHFGEKGFCFRSPLWKALDFQTCRLTEVIRQRGDMKFIEMLNKVRTGDSSVMDELNRRVVVPFSRRAIRIVSTNRELKKINMEHLRSSHHKGHTYPGYLNGRLLPEKEYPDYTLELKVGMHVISIARERDHLYINGTTGVVKALGEDSVYVAFDNGERDWVVYHTWPDREIILRDGDPSSVVTGKYEQIPLMLAYAITVHRVQGKTYERIVVDPRSFESGQLYVALSRCRTLEGIQLMEPVRKEDFRVSEEIREFFGDTI